MSVLGRRDGLVGGSVWAMDAAARSRDFDVRSWKHRSGSGFSWWECSLFALFSSINRLCHRRCTAMTRRLAGRAPRASAVWRCSSPLLAG
eukprot:2233112-Pleurochrysis_carterae.AAC.1